MSTRVRGGKGTLIIDERASGGKLQEYATMTCAHCMTVVALNPERKRARGYCRKCNAYVCDNKVCSEFCAPIKQCLDLAISAPAGTPNNFLSRDKDGRILFDPALLLKGKVY